EFGEFLDEPCRSPIPNTGEERLALLGYRQLPDPAIRFVRRSVDECCVDELIDDLGRRRRGDALEFREPTDRERTLSVDRGKRSQLGRGHAGFSLTSHQPKKPGRRVTKRGSGRGKFFIGASHGTHHVKRLLHHGNYFWREGV